MVLNTRKRGLEYIFQRKGNVILIINRGFSGTVACPNISSDSSRSG